MVAGRRRTSNCPVCGAAELIQETRDLPYAYRGICTVIPAVMGDFCPACGEVILELAEAARISGLMLQFNAQVDERI